MWCVVILIVLSSDVGVRGWSTNVQETRLRNFNDLVHQQVWAQINTKVGTKNNNKNYNRCDETGTTSVI